MNSKKKNESQSQDMEKIREIPKWSRRYAQNRSLTVLVLLGMLVLYGLVTSALLGFPLVTAVIAFWKGNMILCWICMVIFVAVLGALLYGKKILIRFIKKVRNEIEFDSSKALSDQIQKDIQVAEAFFSSRKNQ